MKKPPATTAGGEFSSWKILGCGPDAHRDPRWDAARLVRAGQGTADTDGKDPLMQCPEPGGESSRLGPSSSPPSLTLLALVIGVKATRVRSGGRLEASDQALRRSLRGERSSNPGCRAPLRRLYG